MFSKTDGIGNGKRKFTSEHNTIQICIHLFFYKGRPRTPKLLVNKASFGTKEKYRNFGGYDSYKKNSYGAIWNKGIGK
jgi:hypothetical protein